MASIARTPGKISSIAVLSPRQQKASRDNKFRLAFFSNLIARPGEGLSFGKAWGRLPSREVQ